MLKVRIVVGADGSPGSTLAVRWAAAEARLRSAELRVFTAYHRKDPSRQHDDDASAVVHASASSHGVPSGRIAAGTARPHRSAAARTPSADAKTAAGPCADVTGAAPSVAAPRSIAKMPISTAPTSVVLSTIRPRAIAAARPEPAPTAIVKIAR